MGKTNKDQSEILRKKPRKRDDSYEERKGQNNPDQVWTSILTKINQDKQANAKPKKRAANELSNQVISEYETKNRDNKLVNLMHKLQEAQANADVDGDESTDSEERRKRKFEAKVERKKKEKASRKERDIVRKEDEKLDEALIKTCEKYIFSHQNVSQVRIFEQERLMKEQEKRDAANTLLEIMQVQMKDMNVKEKVDSEKVEKEE